MSKLLLDLDDCQVADTGDVLVKYDTLFKMFRNEQSADNLTVMDHDDVRRYNMKHPDQILHIGHMSGKAEAPPVKAYRFNIPEQITELDLDQYLVEKLVDKFPEMPDVYVDRLCLEMEMMRDREMEELLRVLIYMYEKFQSHGLVYGIGRGSACASLVLYLIGIHMVDPILYDIPIGEFLR